MFLSIIIPTYNSEKTIIPLLDSIKKSRGVDLREIEVAVVDDYSRDETIKKITRFVNPKQGPTLRLIVLKENAGPAHARNVGVKHAYGRVVFFLDFYFFFYL